MTMTNLIPEPLIAWVFGHSIPANGGALGWVARWGQLHTGRPLVVRNYAVGGSTIHNTNGSPLLKTQVQTAIAANPGEVPGLVLIDDGTNDLVNHDTTTIGDSMWAAIDVETILNGIGAHGTWMTILPMGSGTSHPDGWLPQLQARRVVWNTWLLQMAALGSFKAIDMAGVLPEDSVTGLITAAWLELDGLHPSPKGALLVAAAVADATASFG